MLDTSPDDHLPTLRNASHSDKPSGATIFSEGDALALIYRNHRYVRSVEDALALVPDLPPDLAATAIRTAIRVVRQGLDQQVPIPPGTRVRPTGGGATRLVIGCKPEGYQDHHFFGFRDAGRVGAPRAQVLTAGLEPTDQPWRHSPAEDWLAE